jgi:hypothetical protein
LLTKTLVVVVEIAAKGSLLTLILSTIINFMLGASMDQVYGMFVFLQFMVVVTLIKLKLPANALTTFETLTQAATFEILYTDAWFP